MGLLEDWVPKLYKGWTDFKRRHEEELQAISDVVGGTSLDHLVEFYIEPEFQFFNPAETDEDEPIHGFRTPLRNSLNELLRGEFHNRDGRQFLFILADAGMGKSSLLAMLKLSHLRKAWTDVDFKLLKLGPDTLERLAEVKLPRKTVLLLDSLDEDPRALNRVRERLKELLHAAQNFRQILITCRTQFFPQGDETPIERPGKISLESFNCNLLYLSPFTDEQVETYLLRRFPRSLFEKLRLRLTGQDSASLTKARSAIEAMHSLRMRPMLLAYIEELMKADLGPGNEFSVYNALVQWWLDRERRKDEGRVDPARLKKACQVVAGFLQNAGRREISPRELEKLRTKSPEVAEITDLELKGRALMNRTANGEFRFAHYSIQEFLIVSGIFEGTLRYGDLTFQLTEMMDLFFRGTGVRVKALGTRPGAFLAYADLSNSLLGAENLSEADLRFASLSKASLTNAQFHRANLEGADLEGAHLHRANLRLANLQRAHLAGAQLLKAQLAGADLSFANLSQAQLEQADLTSTEILGADLSRAKLSEADLSGANLEKSNLRGASLYRATLIGTELPRVDMEGTHLYNANLTGAYLCRANLRSSRLTGAKLRDADLRGADLRGADLRNAEDVPDLSLTYGDPTTRVPSGISRPEHWSKTFDEQKKEIYGQLPVRPRIARAQRLEQIRSTLKRN